FLCFGGVRSVRAIVRMVSLRFFNIGLVAFGLWSAAAQESIQYGSIAGRVADATGAVIPGARITCRQQETNAGSSVLTDKEGRFGFPYLRAGEYEIVAQNPGFAEARRRVSVGAGSAFDLPIVLAVAASQSEVTVTSQAELLETARTQIAGTVSRVEAAN